MGGFRVEEYLRKDGTSPYEEWFLSQDTLRQRPSFLSLN